MVCGRVHSKSSSAKIMEEVSSMAAQRRVDRDALEELESSRQADRTRIASVQQQNCDLEDANAKLTHQLKQCADEESTMQARSN